MRLRAWLLVLTGALGCADAPAAGEVEIAPAAPRPAASSTAGVALPDVTWEGIGEDGEPRTIALRDYQDGGARLLVVRVNGGTWCGTCEWHAAHTRELRGLARVRWLDLVVGDPDNAPAKVSDLAAWRARLDDPGGIAFGADPSFALRALGPADGILLPLYVLVDTRSLTARAVLSNPGPAELTARVARTLAELDGTAVSEPAPEPLVDGVFRRNERDMIQEAGMLGQPPPDPTNAVADSPAAAALGKKLFFDTGLSPTNRVSCATCHDPGKQLQDGLPRALGLGQGSRKTPRIALASFARWQLWDGRADSLWAQALGPLEEPLEIGATRVGVVRRVVSAFPAQLAAAFPALPLPDLATLPAAGQPGEPGYDALSPSTQHAVTAVFVAAGKALAAYERTFRVEPSALDRYARGDAQAFSLEEKQGLALFARVGCMQCHWGPRLTDDAFHVTRLTAEGTPDPGRSAGLAKLQASAFLGSGLWSDAPLRGPTIPRGPAPRTTVGAFKTPSLRGVAMAGPYGHGGTTPSLVTITEEYGRGGARDPGALGDREPWLATFSVTAQWAIPRFLATLTAAPLVP